jgi:hypothetical protein
VASIRDLIRESIGAAPRPHSTRRAPISKPHGACFCRTAPRPIFRHGAISVIGRQKNIGASTAASACHTTGGRGVPERGWKRPFDEPIPLPPGREFVTLEDAGHYITKLPKAEHEAPEWQAATEALILVATKGGPTMLARIGVMRD